MVFSTAKYVIGTIETESDMQSSENGGVLSISTQTSNGKDVKTKSDDIFLPLDITVVS